MRKFRGPLDTFPTSLVSRAYIPETAITQEVRTSASRLPIIPRSTTPHIWVRAESPEQFLLSDKHDVNFNSNFVQIRLDYVICVHGGPTAPKTWMTRNTALLRRPAGRGKVHHWCMIYPWVLIRSSFTFSRRRRKFLRKYHTSAAMADK